MEDKKKIMQQKFNVLKKLYDAGCVTERDLLSINFQNVFRIKGLTVQDINIISELQIHIKNNKIYSYLGGSIDGKIKE